MPSLTPRDLERIQAVTANYFFWQGLRWVPMGAALLALGLYWSGWWRVPAPLEDAVQLGVLGLTLAISAAFGGYYRRRFGAVRGIAGMHARRERIKWVFVYPAMALSLVADMVFAPPVLLSGFVWGAGILAYRRSTGGGRAHYLVAAPLLGVSLAVGALWSWRSGAVGKTATIVLLGWCIWNAAESYRIWLV